MSNINRKIRKSLQVNGPLGTFKLIVLQPFMLAKERKAARVRNAIQKQFDARYDTDTGGIVALSDLSVEGKNWVHGARYAPTSPERFRECLALLPLDEDAYRRFTFIDIGSGKGATLLYAADLKFDKAIGLELVPSLHEVALRNIAKYEPCRNIGTSVCGDATEYAFPDAPLVIFANNPFPAVVMEGVLKNLRLNRREKYFLHENAAFPLHELESGSFLRPTNKDAICRSYAGQ
jgi:hypothetical protein